MKIAILHCSYDGSTEQIRDLDPTPDPSVYLPGHDCHTFAITRQRAVQQVIDIHRRGFDAIINLCDGAWHGDTAGIEVVQVLERLNAPFTGAGSTLYDPSREAMKMAAHSAGIAFPAYVMAETAKDVDRALARLRFPMLVKHPQGYSSVGLTPSSRVTGAESLRREADATIAAYGAALIEEFIEGREFTVLVTEARHEGEEAWTFAPLEFNFPPGETFKHFDLKWIYYDRMTTSAVTDPDLAGQLRALAARTFTSLGCSGYARCDIRATETGELYLLEVNPNPAVFYPEGQFGSADWILANDPAGHRGFLDHLLQCAIRRRARGERPWRIEYAPARGFGLYARRPIAAGEMVERYEERPATLVSRAHAMRHWTGDRRRWFDQYAWPLTEDTHVMWSVDPGEWRPINHSCDPNTWLDGLDVTARRPVEEGEELTIDYATFCGPAMEQFECNCGAPACRHVITGNDHLLPALRERYRGHVSDYIQQRWDQLQDSTSPGFVAKRTPYGLGVIACQPYRRGDILCPFEWGKHHPRPTVHSIQMTEDRHAEPRPFLLRFINHSCAPNVMFDIESMVVRAVRDIHPGDELGFFYPSTEWEMTQPFQCECDAENCVGWIGGAARLTPAVLDRYDLTGVVGRRIRGTDASGLQPPAEPSPAAGPFPS